MFLELLSASPEGLYYMFAILDKAKPGTRYKRLKLGSGQAYNCSRD
jgi:hypothetical protein